MKVISVPTRLRLAVGLMLFSIPIAAIQTVVVYRAPWWQLPTQAIEFWSGLAALVAVPLAITLIRGGRWALRIIDGLALLWCCITGALAWKTSNSTLWFLAFFLMAYLGVTLAWLRHEMGRAFFDPCLKWYQGLPQPIPGLRCQVGNNELEVSRIAIDGAFLFSQRPPVPGLCTSGEVEMVFAFRGREVRCKGRPVRFLADDAGAGFQFVGMIPDAQKELGDFVELLRGEGHV